MTGGVCAANSYASRRLARRLEILDRVGQKFDMANGKKRNLVKNFLRGRLKFTEFAITNACIAKCSFCDIWKQHPKIFVNKEKARSAIDRLAD